MAAPGENPEKRPRTPTVAEGTAADEAVHFPGLKRATPLQLPKHPEVEAGTLIDGRYKLVKKLGKGGMGTVYSVEHVVLGKRMALKLLRPEFMTNEVAVARFLQE